MGPRITIQKACSSVSALADVLAIILMLTPGAKGDEVLSSSAAQRGLAIVRANCSRCHAIGKVEAVSARWRSGWQRRRLHSSIGLTASGRHRSEFRKKESAPAAGQRARRALRARE